MHITDSIKNNFYICDCCGAKLAPDEVAFEGKDIEGNDVHICIDCENYEQEPEMADVLEESSLKEVNPKNSLGESIAFNKILSESDESMYNAHKEFEKDQLNKKEDEDNQENFTFDEGSVKLATVKESKIDWNKFFDNLTESVDEDNAMFMSYINNLFNDDEIGRCPECGMAITDEDELEDGSHECPKCGSILEDHGPSADFWDIEDDE